MDAKWKRDLRRRAGSHGMCEDKRHALEQMSNDIDAVNLYLGSIEWALGENYPTMQEISENFPRWYLENAGIFIGREFHGETLVDLQRYVFHNCSGTIRVGLNVPKAIIPLYYFANGCDMTLKSCGEFPHPVRIPLFLYGSNAVVAEHSQNIECNIKRFDAK